MLLWWALLQLLSYGLLTWLLFVAVAFLAARYGRGPGIFGGHFLLALLIAALDVAWIQSEMNKPGWAGQPDQDIVFSMGVLVRVVLINSVLLPVSVLGLYRADKHSARPSAAS